MEFKDLALESQSFENRKPMRSLAAEPDKAFIASHLLRFAALRTLISWPMS